MKIEFDTVVRGVEVMIYTSDFYEEPENGIPMGTDNVWAKTAKGKDFPLTNEEENDLAAIALEMYWERLKDDDEG